MKTFQKSSRTNDFTLSAELQLDSHSDAAAIMKQAGVLASTVDAIQVTDSPGGRIHLTPLIAAGILLDNGIDPILHMTCSYRNRIALQSDLLGAAALGVTSLILMRGDKISETVSAHSGADFDWGVKRLIADARYMQTNPPFAEPVNFYIGSVATVFKPGRDWKPENITNKIDVGIKFIQTQLCFDIDLLRHYMARLVSEKLIERIGVIVGAAPVPSAETALWLGKNLRGAVMPRKIVKRLRQSKNPQREGELICAELLNEAAQIPGVSGANLTSFGNPESIVEAVKMSGVGRASLSSAK